jgi:sigma-E factor negative regulatory protein RseA
MMKRTAMNETSVALTTERISTLLDGEMDRAEAEAAIGALCADTELRRWWHELHRVGDALRSNEVAARDAPGFCARVAAAIDAEPTVLAPGAARSSADRSGLRRYWIPGVAVAASIAAVGFIAVPLLRAPETMSIAKNTAPLAGEASAIDLTQKGIPTIANARGLNPALTPYLAAHRELNGNSVVPRAAVYLRSDEGR